MNRENLYAQAKATMQDLGMVTEGMDDLVHDVMIASGTKDNILLLGETGVGKGVVARAIDALMRKQNGGSTTEMFERNCAAIPEDLAESELFGHVQGAFTGAVSDRIGIIQEASGGRLFLDEIGDLSRPMQAKLLHVIEGRSLSRVGSNDRHNIDVQFLAATSPDKALRDGSAAVRQDLFHRLAGEVIHIPPFRERPPEAKNPTILSAFLQAPKSSNHVPDTINVRVDDEVVQLLAEQNFSGNVRQVEQIARRIYRIAEVQALESNEPPTVIWIRRQHVTEKILEECGGSEGGANLSHRFFDSQVRIDGTDKSIQELEGDLFLEYLRNLPTSCNTSVKIAARMGITRGSLRNKVIKLSDRIGFASPNGNRGIVTELVHYLRYSEAGEDGDVSA